MSGDNQSIDGLMKELFDFCESDSLSEDGLREIIERYIDRYGALPKNQNITDYEFFHEACRNEAVTEGILRLLLDNFPDAASYIYEAGESPLHWICWNKNATLGMVELLIDVHPESLRRATSVPLHWLCLNENLNEKIGLDILKLLLKKYPESIRHADKDGDLPIHLAATNKSPEFCRILIEAYPGSISVANNNGLYPIYYVMDGLTHREGYDPEVAVEVVQLLLDCNTNVVSQKYLDKFPLYWFCVDANSENAPKLNAYLEILQLLYDAFPEAIEEDTITSNVESFCPEVQTFINAQLVYVRQARDHSVMHSPDESGQLPLHVALRDNVTLGSIKLLAKGNPSATRNFDNRGMLPLHVACQHHKSPKVVEYLVDLRSSALEMEDRWQNTLLHFACHCANHAMIAFLLEKYDAAFVSTRNSHKQLPIDLLFDSEAVSDREGIEYMDSIYRLIRANPETVMGCNMNTNMNVRQQAQSEIGKKRKIDDL